MATRKPPWLKVKSHLASVRLVTTASRRGPVN